MEELLLEISKQVIELGDFDFNEIQKNNNWIGNSPATNEEISLKEKELNIILPKDYKEFLLISNGYAASNDIEPSFEKIERIDFLKNVIPEIIENYQIEELSESLIIAGFNGEQQFFLIPPKNDVGWRYWKFANWQAGEHEFENLENYFLNIIEFNKEQIDNRKNPDSKIFAQQENMQIKDYFTPLILVDGKKVNVQDFSQMNQENFVRSNYLRSEEAILKYGDSGKNGVIEVSTLK